MTNKQLAEKIAQFLFTDVIGVRADVLLSKKDGVMTGSGRFEATTAYQILNILDAAKPSGNRRADPVRDELVAALKNILEDPDMQKAFDAAENRTGIYADRSIPSFNAWCKRTAQLVKNARAVLAKAEGGA